MVIAPARTGKDNNKKKLLSIAQANNAILCIVRPGARIFKMVVIKFAAPRIEDAPARCKDKIARSIDIPGVPAELDIGG